MLQRIWPFLLMAVTTVWVGARALTPINLSLLSALLGALLPEPQFRKAFFAALLPLGA